MGQGRVVEMMHTEPPRKLYNLKEKSSRKKAELEIRLSGPLTNRREAGSRSDHPESVLTDKRKE